jgi:hypothetical protein
MFWRVAAGLGYIALVWVRLNSCKGKGTQWHTQDFFFQGGFNKFSWGQTAERTGIWGQEPPSQWFHSICKCVKPVFLLGSYGCIFHRTGNLAGLCQNFWISGGGFEPPKPPLGTPLKPHDVRFRIEFKEVENLCEVIWYELSGFCLSEYGESHYNQKQCVFRIKTFCYVKHNSGHILSFSAVLKTVKD